MMARLGWSSRKAAQSQEADLAALLERLEEPTAICDLHGVVRLSNQAWRAILGPGAAGGFTDGGLFTTFKLARRDGRAKASLRLGGAPHIVTVASLNDERFLVRLAPEPAAPAPKPPAWGPSTLSAASVFAEAPFGAALIQGEDPFTAPIIEANRALPAVVGRPVPPGTPLADLLDRAYPPPRLTPPGPPDRTKWRSPPWPGARLTYTSRQPAAARRCICWTSPSRRACSSSFPNATRWRP